MGRRAVLLLVSLSLSACVGAISDPDGETPIVDEDLDPSDLPTPEECEDTTPTVAYSPIRRLTGGQYDLTVQDLLGTDHRPGVDFAPDTSPAGYATNSDVPLDGVQLEDYRNAAELLAQEAVDTRLSDWFSCDIADDTCVRDWIDDFGARAFRRPLTAELRDSLAVLYTEGRDSWDAETGVRMVIEAVLMSPHFLYIVEEEPGSELTQLDGYAIATRLSYFLWQTMPDDALLAAAAAGELDTPEGIEIQARRMMLETNRMRRGVESFHAQWLGLDDSKANSKNPTLYPFWSTDLRDAMREETMAFVNHVVLEDGQLTTLFTAPYSFIDARLSPIYGDAASGSTLSQTSLDSTRAGILTQPRFLAAHAHAAEPSWVSRGLFVRTQLLCQQLPDPPADVEMEEANDPDRVSDPQCGACHQRIDPVGQGFDQYDAVGAFRTERHDGTPVDGRGELIEAELEQAEFTGLVDLGQRLADNPLVQSCVSRQWLRYATGRMERGADACSVSRMQSRFAESGHDIRELMVAIATSDAFRFRTQSPEEGQ